MKAFWTTVVLALSVYLGGCAPTPYQRARVAFGHGYAEKKFLDDTFSVVFNANYATSTDTLREYLYRRAAALTLRHKFRYFAVVREPRPLIEYRIIYRRQEDAEAGVNDEEVELPVWGTLQMAIQCFKNDSPPAGVPLIDAKTCLPEKHRPKPR